MAIKLELHEEDERELRRIRLDLANRRRAAGLSQEKLAAQAGHSEKWLVELETGHGHYHLSSLQDWAKCFGLRVQPTLGLPDVAGYEVPHGVDSELRWLEKMAGQFDAASWVRVWCVAELRWERCWRGVTGAQMSRRLGLSASAVPNWERGGDDPLVSKLMTYARALDGRMTFELLDSAAWEAKIKPREMTPEA